MRNILLLGLTALVLFGVSAGSSWYLRHLKEQQEEASADQAAAADGLPKGQAANPPSLPANNSVQKGSSRPGYNPEAEGTVHLAASLRDRLEAVRLREQQLTTRQKHLDLIYQDIRSERAAIDDLRKQLNDEFKLVREKTNDLERRAGDLDTKKQEGIDQVKEIKKSFAEYEGVESERIKQMAGMYDAMAPENAAKILQQMADTGNTDTAVKVLAMMKERQAARVLAELPDPSMAAGLLDKMKTLKKPSPAATKK